MATTQSNTARIEELSNSLSALNGDNENSWLLWAGTLTLFMQAGFFCLEAGSVQTKHVTNLLIKSIIDVCFVAVFYWGFGYAFAYGASVDQSNKINAGFIGDTNFFYSGNPTELQPNFEGYAHMFFQFTFACVAVSIVTSSLAERASTFTYVFISVFFAGFVYPVVSHWAWATRGYLCPWQNFQGKKDLYLRVGTIDFAGSSVVHLCAATAAFWGCFFLGPRKGRFDAAGNASALPSQSATMKVLGALLLFVGTYGMTIGMTYTHGFAGFSAVAGRVAINTTLSAAGAAITSVFICGLKTGAVDLTSLLNGFLTGLVSICSGCATVAPWAAFLTGVFPGMVYQGGSWLSVHLFRLDDVTDAVAIHGWGGLWGMVATGFLSRGPEMLEVYGSTTVGIIYGGGRILGANLVHSFVNMAWTSLWMAPSFWICSHIGVMRNDTEDKTAVETSEIEMTKA